tara:strand:+ start:309 stop:3641 length:3333 start_codon:yes stop_codon:yes gene_type:complete
MDVDLFEPSDLYIQKHDVNSCDAFYHEESKCWLFWSTDNTLHVYLRETCMDSFCPEPRLDHVGMFGYFLAGVSDTSLYVYDWSTWALVFCHDFKEQIVSFGIVYTDIYTLTCKNELYNGTNIIETDIDGISCSSKHLFYHNSNRLKTVHQSIEAKYILALFQDDTYIYALRNRNTIDYWDHALIRKHKLSIPSNISIQSIEHYDGFFMIQTLSDMYILDKKNTLIYHNTYEESTWLVLIHRHLCISSDDKTRVYDMTRACTCFHLKENNYVELTNMLPCYARIMAQNVKRWFYRTSCRMDILFQHKPLFRLFLNEHCYFVLETGELKYIERVLRESPDNTFCHQHLLKFCSATCKEYNTFQEHLITLLVFLFEQIAYHPTRDIWSYCCMYASSCYYWFSLVLSHPKSHLLIKNMFRCDTIRSVLTCLHQDKVQEMCQYGLLPFWIRVCHEYHTQHFYHYQPKVALFRNVLIDTILTSGYVEYGTYRKAGFSDLTPMLKGRKIRHHSIEGVVESCRILPDRSREWSWNNDMCLLPEISKEMSFEIFEPVRGYPRNTLEAALHMLDTEHFWNFSSGWECHPMCDCIVHNRIRHKATKKESLVLKHTPTHIIILDDIVDNNYFDSEYEVFKKECRYHNSFIQNTKLLHFILDTIKDTPTSQLSKEYKDALFYIMKTYSDVTIEYIRQPISCLFLNRFGNKLFIADDKHLIKEDNKAVSFHEDTVCDMLSMGSNFVSGSINGVVKVQDRYAIHNINTVKGPMTIRWFRKRLIWILHNHSHIIEYNLDTYTMTRTFEPLRVQHILGFEIAKEHGYICTPDKIMEIDGSGHIKPIFVPNVVWSCIGFENFFHVLLGTTKGHIYKIVNSQCVPYELKHKRALTHVGVIHGLVVAIDEEEITLYHDDNVFMKFELFPDKIIRFQYDIYGRCMIAFENRYMTIYWDHTIRLKCANLWVSLLQRESFSAYIHEYQIDHMMNVVSEMETEDVLEIIHTSTKEYDHRRMWCKPWVFNLCMDDQGSLATRILRRLVFYTGTKFDNCSICFENIPNQEVIRLKCGHLFHRSCIEQYFKSLPSYKDDMLQEYALQVEASCPNCRAPCTPNDITKDDFWTTQNTGI